MRSTPTGRLMWLLAIALVAFVAACGRAIVIVPAPDRSYTERDTLYGYIRDDRVVVSFRFDSVLRVDTVTKLDTLWRGGTRTIVRVDTVRVPTPVQAPAASPTGTRVPPRPTGTTQVPLPDPVMAPAPSPRVDTVYITRRDTIRITRRDTVVVTRRDTIRLAGRDTVFRTDTIVRRDTIRIAGRRTLFVPPGQYPPAGLCRVWVHDLPPGRQANAAPCNALGNIPAGAFILFGGDAWDADYDWVLEAQRSRVPPEIVALARRRRP